MAFEDILKIFLSEDALTQLSLPTSHGGMGIPTPSRPALPAFAASTHAPKTDVLGILGPGTDQVHLRSEALREFIETYGEAPNDDDRPKQAEWTILASERILTDLRLKMADSEVDSIRLTAVTLPDSGWWLQALPSVNLGTLLSDVESSKRAFVPVGRR